MAGTTTYSVSCSPEEARAILDQFFTERGWRTNAPREDGAVVYEKGKRGMTLMLGALAGDNFYLTAVTHVVPADGGAQIRYVWGGADGIAGGALGVRKAKQARTELGTGIEQALAGRGVLSGVQRDAS